MRREGKQFSLRAGLAILVASIAVESVLPGLLSPCSAMDISADGATKTVTMAGPVVSADCDTLEQLLAKNKIDLVVLTESSGGNAAAGYCVGALIRKRGLATTIRGRCASSCSRMWLGGVERSLDGPNSRVGLHGNYATGGGLLPDAPNKLREWIPQYAPSVDRALMEQWIHLPVNKSMMYFYNARAELCEKGACTPISGRNALNVELATK